MNKNITKEILNDFNERYPKYKDELKISLNNEKLTLTFHGISYMTIINNFHYDYESTDELICLTVTDIFTHLVSTYELKKVLMKKV